MIGRLRDYLNQNNSRVVDLLKINKSSSLLVISVFACKKNCWFVVVFKSQCYFIYDSVARYACAVFTLYSMKLGPYMVKEIHIHPSPQSTCKIKTSLNNEKMLRKFLIVFTAHVSIFHVYWPNTRVFLHLINLIFLSKCRW